MVEVSKTRRDLKITTVLVVLQLEVDFGYTFLQNFPLLEVLETQPTSISGLGNLTRWSLTQSCCQRTGWNHISELGKKDAAQRRHNNPALNHITGKRTRWLCGGGNNAIPIWRLSVVMMVMTMTKMMMSMTMTMTMTMMMTTKTTGDNTWQQLPDGTKCSGPPKYFPDPDNCRMFYFCYRGCFTHNTVLMGPFS